ncbi:putative COBRA-like protein 1 [Cocos nucifera]|uniref:Putative COBRA-like protein 1 n=1 Tax=Cocos nucifera TaxID=13894 RepID=A0A8K0IIG9_COCNU|nr:putative COBRA-like protein 1 [Cocos nucifera]
MAGALATQQGDCSGYKYRTLHCCKRDPVIIDLMPDAAPENRTANCCRGGILSAWAIDQPTSFSSFIMVVAGLDAKVQKPQNLTLCPTLRTRSVRVCMSVKELIPTNNNNNMSFNNADEAAIFWGLEYHNKELLQAGDGEPGSVTTEMVMHKDPGSFTLRNGWAFPRKVYFNGEICAMPMPDDFPRLPNTSSRPSNACHLVFILCLLILFFHQKF